MDRTVRKHRSFEDADQADLIYYRSLTPEQRMNILLELTRQRPSDDGTEPRLERVYRIIKLKQS